MIAAKGRMATTAAAIPIPADAPRERDLWLDLEEGIELGSMTMRTLRRLTMLTKMSMFLRLGLKPRRYQCPSKDQVFSLT